MKFPATLSKWVILPALVAVLGIGGSVYSWIALSQSEEAIRSAESSLQASQGSYEKRLEGFDAASEQADKNIADKVSCEIVLGASECAVYETMQTYYDEQLDEATQLLSLAKNGVTDAQAAIEESRSQAETWRFISFAVVTLTVLTLLSIIAVAVVIRRK